MSRNKPTIRVEGPALAGPPSLPSAAKFLDVSSTDPDEDCTLLLRGLGQGWPAQEGRLTLNGTTWVQSAEKWLRLNTASLCGWSGPEVVGVAKGTITIKHGTMVLATIEPGQPCMWSAIRSVPPTTWIPHTDEGAPPAEEQVDPTNRHLVRVRGTGAMKVVHRQHNAPGLSNDLHDGNGNSELHARPYAAHGGDIWIDGDGSFASFDLEVGA